MASGTSIAEAVLVPVGQNSLEWQQNSAPGLLVLPLLTGMNSRRQAHHFHVPLAYSIYSFHLASVSLGSSRQVNYEPLDGLSKIQIIQEGLLSTVHFNSQCYNYVRT